MKIGLSWFRCGDNSHNWSQKKQRLATVLSLDGEAQDAILNLKLVPYLIKTMQITFLTN